MSTTERDDTWYLRGACREKDPRVFDGPEHGSMGNRDTQRDWSLAKMVCSRCQVQPECLDYVLDMPMDGAFAAGLEPVELNRLREKRRAGKLRRKR